MSQWMVTLCALVLALCVVALMAIAEGDVSREVVIDGRSVLVPPGERLNRREAPEGER
jgi:hypothetical protein